VTVAARAVASARVKLGMPPIMPGAPGTAATRRPAWRRSLSRR
jgi:hypothetical protein